MLASGKNLHRRGRRGHHNHASCFYSARSAYSAVRKKAAAKSERILRRVERLAFAVGGLIMRVHQAESYQSTLAGARFVG